MESADQERVRRPPPSEREVAAWVGLSQMPGIGPRTIARWVEKAGSAEAVWDRLPEFAGSGERLEQVLAAWRSLDPGSVVESARRDGVEVIALCDPSYPRRLAAIPAPPPVLFVRGRLDDSPAVAIVGARRATPYGRAAAGQLACDLALAGVCVVSGLARGIDGAAHRAALDAGGRTVAVLGCGVDVVYPPEHSAMAGEIAKRGAVVSEFSPGTPPLPGHFPRRNRIVSGLALGVVVVEGAEDSGALITVDYALEQGREVFAVPGSVFSSKSRAPHALLRQGARIVESAADILDELGLPTPGEAAEDPVGLRVKTGREGPENRILSLLEEGPMQLDELVDACEMPAATLAALVTVLELKGMVRALPGQVFVRTVQQVPRCPGGSSRPVSGG